jgi:CobQ-like glutamine amidotransferase family enzyme
LLPRNPWLADWIIARALARRNGDLVELEALPDELEASAQAVSAERARSRGGRY